MKRTAGKAGRILICFGAVFIIAAAALTGYNIWDETRAKAASEVNLTALTGLMSAGDGLEDIPDYMVNPDMEMPVAEVDGRQYIGVLDIPKLSLNLPVMSRWSDEGLRIAPGRYSGSAYKSGFVIAAHNYPAHFGHIKELSLGDQVIFTDVRGRSFAYTVTALDILGPYETEEMVSSEWDLSLFTCTFGGRSRVTVRCERADI